MVPVWGSRGVQPSEAGAFVRYGNTPGQLEGLPPGSIDAVVASPPYAESINAQSHGIDWSKAGSATGNRQRGEGSKHEATLRDQLGLRSRRWPTRGHACRRKTDTRRRKSLTARHGTV